MENTQSAGDTRKNARLVQITCKSPAKSNLANSRCCQPKNADPHASYPTDRSATNHTSEPSRGEGSGLNRGVTSGPELGLEKMGLRLFQAFYQWLDSTQCSRNQSYPSA